MIAYQSFHCLPLNVWPAQATLVEEHFAHIVGELVAIPHAKVAELVPPQKQALDLQRRERMIDARQPLRHAVVVRILGTKRELLEAAHDGRTPVSRAPTQAAIGADRLQRL